MAAAAPVASLPKTIKARVERRDGVVIVDRRWHMVKAQSVIESQPATYTPVILRIPFEVMEQVTPDRPVVGLHITVDAPKQGIGEAIAGIQRIIAVRREVVVSPISGTCPDLRPIFHSDCHRP